MAEAPPATRPGPKAVPVVAALGLLVALSAGSAVPAHALALPAAWSIGLGASGTGEAVGGGAPAAPTGATSACVSAVSNQVTVTWNAVTQATTYSVYYSTVSSSGPYSLLASGITGTTYTTGGLAVATFWFEVAAVTGTNWQGPNSGPTAGRTIVALTCV